MCCYGILSTTGGMQAFYALYSSLCSRPDDPPSRPFLYSPTTPVVELDVDAAQMSEILPFLFLGNSYHLGISPRVAFQSYASGRPRANQN